MFERKNWSYTANNKQMGERYSQAQKNEQRPTTSQRIESNHRSDIEVMTAQEVADLLRVSRWSVYEMVKRHDIPFFKVGRSVRFDRNSIEVWMNEKAAY